MNNRLMQWAVPMIAGLAVLAGAAAAARAEGNVAGGTGLYLTHAAETLAPGEWRFGAYGQFVRYVVSEDPENWDLAPQLAWSPARNLELMAALPLLRHHKSPAGSETGVGDGVLGLKYRVFPRVAALGYVTLPVGDEERGLGSGETDYGVAGIVSVPLGGKVSAHLNLGYQVAGGDRDDSVTYGLGLSVPVAERTRLFGEIAGQSFGDRHTHDTVQFDLGVRHRLNERLSLTVGGGRGLRGDYGPEDSELRLFAGVHFLFGGAPPAAAPATVPAPAAASPAAPPTAAPRAVAPPAAPAAVPATAPPRPAAPPAAAAPLPAAPPAVSAPAPGPSSEEIAAAKQRLAAAEILFEYDRTRLTPEGARALQQVLADLLKYPGMTFMIEGHADDRGTSTYNKVLALRRAETVMRALVKGGVAFGRMKVATQGELKPKVAKQDAQSRALNRRVAFAAHP